MRRAPSRSAPPSQPMTRGAQRRDEPVPPARIADDLGAVERRAQHGGVRDLAAQAAADAALDHGGDRDRCAAGPDWASRSATGSRTGGCRNGRRCRSPRRRRSACAPRARRARACAASCGAHAALARQLAFAVGDDHLEAALGGAHRLAAASRPWWRRCRCAPCAATSRPWRAASSRCPCRRRAVAAGRCSTA